MKLGNFEHMHSKSSGWMGGWMMGGWMMGGWMAGWMGGLKAVLRIAYSNQQIKLESVKA